MIPSHFQRTPAITPAIRGRREAAGWPWAANARTKCSGPWERAQDAAEQKRAGMGARPIDVAELPPRADTRLACRLARKTS